MSGVSKRRKNQDVAGDDVLGELDSLDKELRTRDRDEQLGDRMGDQVGRLERNFAVVQSLLDISASITEVDSSFRKLPEIGKNPCAVAAGETPSSLVLKGRGGLPRQAGDDVLLPADGDDEDDGQPSTKQDGAILLPGGTSGNRGDCRLSRR